MTQQCGRLLLLVVVGEAGVVVGGGGEGEKGKINTASALFPARQSEGIHCGGMMIYVRGGRAVRVRRGRRCAPIMINALHPGDWPASTTPTPAPPSTGPLPPSGGCGANGSRRRRRESVRQLKLSQASKHSTRFASGVDQSGRLAASVQGRGRSCCIADGSP